MLAGGGTGFARAAGDSGGWGGEGSLLNSLGWIMAAVETFKPVMQF